MPLPASNTPWPPASLAPVYSKFAEWSAWYSNDPGRIIDFYNTSAASDRAAPFWRYWSRARAGRDTNQRALLHVPVASDLAAVSASLLFGEPPRIRIKAAHEEEKPDPEPDPGVVLDPEKPKAKPETPEQKAEARMQEIIERGSLISRLLEAAESSAAIGGVYIYPVWDKDLVDVPILASAQSDQAIPEFKWGILTRVTFHREVIVDGNQVWRHVEVHEVEGTGDSRKAVVLNALYKGSHTSIGMPVDLAASPATIRLESRVELPFQELDVQYVPNIRPNRLWRATSFGAADIQGSEGLLDAIDEVYASWVRDIRLAKARIIVPRDYLRNDAQGNARFDVDREVYTEMDMEPGLAQDARAMFAHQFAIRYLEHRATAQDFINRVVSNAGYAVQTMGATQSDQGGGYQHGPAMRISEHKTLLTLRRKSAWWRAALSRVVYHMALIDKEVFGATTPVIQPSVEMSDSVIDNPLELAQTALALKSAESASIETRVRLQRPDWTDAEVASEVLRIKDEAPSEPALQIGTFGGPKADPAATDNLPTTSPEKGKPDSSPFEA